MNDEYIYLERKYEDCRNLLRYSNLRKVRLTICNRDHHKKIEDLFTVAMDAFKVKMEVICYKEIIDIRRKQLEYINT
ncbi:hypothetical protein GJ496_006703 [Pomphorhynchus laevis]|nr:hypothetical protein GJ496_006703 [Pomphorhynchus laevis]